MAQVMVRSGVYSPCAYVLWHMPSQEQGMKKMVIVDVELDMQGTRTVIS